MKFKYKYSVILAFLVLGFSGCESDDSINEEVVQFSELTQQITDSSGIVSEVYSEKVVEVAPGVVQTDIHFLDMRGYSTRLYIQRVDMNTPGLSFEVATPYDLPTYGASQTIPEMAEEVDGPGNWVLGGINSDFYDVSNYVPLGPLHKDGEIIKGEFTPLGNFPAQALSFVGVLENGELYIGYKEEYEALKDQLTEVTGGGVLLMKDNKIVDNPQFPSVQPRIAMGYTDDNIIYFMVVDGRDFYYSNGMTYDYMSKFFNSLGVNSAINLDGGGSSTIIIRNPLAEGVFQMRNKPSDGHARPVSNGWLVVSDQPLP